MIRVFLVDDHEVVRIGLRCLIDGEPDMRTAGEAATCAQARTLLPHQPADVAILDVRLPDCNGIELCRDLRDLLPGLRLLILTSYSDEEAIIGAVLAGANAYLVKDVGRRDLLDAVRAVAQGKSLLDTHATAALMRRLRADTAAGRPGPLHDLTDREYELLRMLGAGLTNRQIARRMFLSERTVKNYVSQLLRKLGLERRAQAAVVAARLGLAPDMPEVS
ncbi:response regulator transcription factor [Nocardia sp. 2]|uniref:Response regulator transcription factor n=1 Tax=Nocardia acididurans TaxID=2802282 RepID=A0ABS1ML48_9NOCA|nr:response regulator transcription factor [Nocardia acididurans]MBL1079988.1 response regulator transcription factor [Nocardia acididurans]